jgi:putative flippase GtrA
VSRHFWSGALLSATDLVTRISQRRGVRQFVKFGIVGASGFIVNLLIFTLIFTFTPVAEHLRIYSLAYSISFLAGGVSNYVFNRVWTFRATGHPLVQGLQFLIVSAAALGVGLGASHLLEPYLGPGHRLWFVGTISGMVVNFFANKYWTFRSES